LVRLAKEEYKKKLTSQLTDNTIPPGKWWRIAKSVCKQSIPPLKHGGIIIVHPSEKCEIFNQYF
jgi:hypothetical protein